MSDDSEPFFIKLKIETERWNINVNTDNDDIVVVGCFDEVDLMMSSQGLHKLRLVSSLPKRIN